MENRIDIGVYVDNSDANKKFKETIGSLENLLKFETILNGKGMVSAFNTMAVATKPYIAGVEMATKASKKFNDILAQQNKAAVSSLFSSSKKTSAFDLLRQSAGQTLDILDRMPQSMTKITGTFSPMREAWETSKKGIMGFNGALLSTLFFGMEMQRIFGGALKSIFEGYKKIIPEAHEFNKMVTQLSANWEFFKFQLADALGKSALFQTFVQIAITLLKAFQGLSEPVKTFIGYLLIAGAALGTFMLYFGIIGLGVAGLVDLAAAAGKVGVAFSGMTAWLVTPQGIAFLGLAATIGLIVAGMVYLYTKTEIGAKKFDSLSNAMGHIIDNIIPPILAGFKVFGDWLKNNQDILIKFGAVFNNIFVMIGTVLNSFVLLLRIVFNSIQIVLDTIYYFAKAITQMFTLDFKGAMNSWRTWKNSVSADINDVANAYQNAALAAQDMKDAWVSGEDVNKMVTEYSAQIAKDSYDNTAKDSNGVVNNYIVIDGAAQSTSFTQQQREFMQTIQGTSMLSGGSKNGWTS